MWNDMGGMDATGCMASWVLMFRLFLVLIMALVMLGNAHSWAGVASAVALGVVAVLFLANELTDFTPWGYLKDRKRRRAKSRRKDQRRQERGGRAKGRKAAEGRGPRP
jgi:hypothetical protein